MKRARPIGALRTRPLSEVLYGHATGRRRDDTVRVPVQLLVEAAASLAEYERRDWQRVDEGCGAAISARLHVVQLELALLHAKQKAGLVPVSAPAPCAPRRRR